MKFKLLSVGQKFKYQDEIYVKTSPIIASNVETGHNKMIPAYATLTLLDNSGEDIQSKTKKAVDAGDILYAFNSFYEKCIKTLEANDVLVPEIKDELDKARDEFTEHLHEQNN